MKRLLSIILAIICIFSFALLCFAHSGRTDTNGGHFDNSTGEYHYHNGDSFSLYYSNDYESTTRKSFDEIMSERNETKNNSGFDTEYYREKAKRLDEEEYQKLVEDYKKQELTDNATSLIISLFVTLLAYGAFPFIFAKTKKTPITKKKYKRLCYGINIVVLFIFAIINGTFNIAPYILWTWIFSKYGMKVLGTKGLMPDSDYLEDSPVYLNQQEASNAETISYCRNCGNKLFDDSSFCNKCGTEVIYNKTTQDYNTPSNVQAKNSELVYGEDIKLNKIKSNSFSDKDYETMLKCISFSIRLYKNEFEKEEDNRTTEEKEEDLETLQSLEELFDVFLSKQKPGLLQNILAIACVRTYFEFIDSQLNNNPSEERKKWLLQQLEEISSVFPKLEPMQRN